MRKLTLAVFLILFLAGCGNKKDVIKEIKDSKSKFTITNYHPDGTKDVWILDKCPKTYDYRQTYIQFQDQYHNLIIIPINNTTIIEEFWKH